MMTERQPLPDDFLHRLQELEQSYLTETDPIRQSGFGGGPERWRAERGPIIEAVQADGDFLDVGCANGYLLECLVEWARERGITLVPYGLDIGTRLIELARERLPVYAAHFWVGNAWEWEPPRRFGYVYTLHGCVPLSLLEQYVRRLLSRFVARGGRLIVGAYGSRSRGTPPFDLVGFCGSAGLPISGTATGGLPPVTSFVWLDAV